MKVNKHLLFSISACASVVLFAAAPFVAQANQSVCAPDDTGTACTCNVNGYSPETLAGADTVNLPPPGTVQPGDYIVASEDNVVTQDQ